ncbi:YfgM family protein [Glaciecola sp. 2405UD65-10]|uniref:YfgM family protein n=1 Tax=Glaciecola sp. 2405UD65-10 TaxID=3397244 RepID=UPI003B591936
MIGYETEEQQVQAIKQFWKDNGTAIILGAVIGIGGLWGWRYYNDSTIATKEAASTEFNKSIETFIDSESPESLNAFIEANKDSGYAPLAALVVAQEAITNDDFEAAKAALRQAIANDEDVSNVARIRLANIHIELAEYTQALSILDEVSADAFSAQVNELKGDALLAQQDFDAAQTAYAASLDDAPNNNNVKMKLDNIAYAKNKQVSTESE